MVAKHSRKSARVAKSAEKTVKIRKHHAKPYRKRHIGSLIILIAAFVILLAILIQYRDQLMSGLASSRAFVAGLFEQDKEYGVTITSAYGFGLTFDQKEFYASAIDAQTGDLHLGSELAIRRAYDTVRVAPLWAADSATNGSALTVTYHDQALIEGQVPTSIALSDADLTEGNLDRTATDTVSLGGQQFEKVTWQSKEAENYGDAFTTHFVTYAGVVRGDVVTIVISLGLDSSQAARYKSVLDSVTFNGSVGTLTQPSEAVTAKASATRSVLDVITNTQFASAATTAASSSEKIAALYSPAVVKVYHAYCMDVTVQGKLFARNICSGGSGSGFFVSSDGYLATNGHVVKMEAKDVAIQLSLNQLISKNDTRYLYYLLNLTTLRPSDLAGMSATEAVATMADAIYELNDSVIKATNSVDNLMVVLTDTEPDVTAFWESTQKRKVYSGDSEAVVAKLIASDYRVVDGYDGYRASDVAILKVDGTNFPVVALASIDTVTQGSDISIIGYPGKASSNGLVDSSAAQATLTSGKVSSIKDVENSDKRLIETDTTIGHGNSGGPVFNDRGGVVGIATYTVDGSGDGDGIYNYVRDVQDLIDLSEDENVAINAYSRTQELWDKGIEDFYTSHYSRAVKNFKEVKTLYPNHSRVEEFIAAAETRIANGEDVVDFPVVPVIIAAVVVLIAAGGVTFVIVRHNKKHKIYNAGVAQGTVQPVSQVSTPQVVSVTPGQPTVQQTQLPTPSAAPTVTPNASTEQPWFGPDNTHPNDQPK
jgi:serine protease Do